MRTNSVEELRAVQDFIVHLDRSLAVLPPLKMLKMSERLFRGINVPVNPVCVCVRVCVCVCVPALLLPQAMLPAAGLLCHFDCVVRRCHVQLSLRR